MILEDIKTVYGDFLRPHYIGIPRIRIDGQLITWHTIKARLAFPLESLVDVWSFVFAG